VLLVLLLIPSWRAMLGLAAIPSVLQFFGVLLLPESPRWLMKEGRTQEARSVIGKLYHPDFTDQRFEELTQEAEKLRIESSLSETDRLKSLFTTYRRCLAIGCGVQAAQQFSGINTAMYYGPSIMIAANITIGNYSEKISGLILNIPLSFTNAVGTILSIFFIDSLGRRYVMLRSLPVIVFAFLVVATGMFLLPPAGSTESTQLPGDLAFYGTLLFLLTFGIGMSSTPWTVCSEVFPLHVVGTANSLTTTTNWLSNFVVASIFPLMLNQQSLKGWAFVLLAICSAISWVFIYLMLPETANKEIHQILSDILGDKYKSISESETQEAENDLSNDIGAKP